jgi:carboxymethylenebutenolidase
MAADLRTEMVGSSYLVLPNGEPPHPGVVIIHEVYGLNNNIRDICHRFAEQGYAALGVDLFAGRTKPICMARIFVDWLAGRLDSFVVGDLKAAVTQLSQRPEVDGSRIGAVGFCLGGTLALAWACTDGRLKAIEPYYGSAPRRREALRRLCPVVGSWPEKDFHHGRRWNARNGVEQDWCGARSQGVPRCETFVLQRSRCELRCGGRRRLMAARTGVFRQARKNRAGCNLRPLTCDP